MLARLRADERGAVMVVAAAALTALLLFAGLALDFGRGHLLRAQLQTAVDAAALAGALQAVPMAELQVSRWVAETEECTDPITRKPYRCVSWSNASPVTVSGAERYLIRQGGWRTATAGDCSWPYRCSPTYSVERRWLQLPADDSIRQVARSTFYENARWPGGSAGPQVQQLEVSADPLKTEVTATASLTMPTTFLRLAMIDHLQITRTGSAVPVRR